MNYAIEILSVLLGTIASSWLAWKASKLTRRYWVTFYFVALFIVLSFALSKRFPSFEFIPPVSWLMLGWAEYFWISIAIPGVLVTTGYQLKETRPRIMLNGVMIISAFYMGLFPIICSWKDSKAVSKLETNSDKDGVCLQSTDYTCGPAAAVTALQYLNIHASEADLSVEARTSFKFGTSCDFLSDAVITLYGEKGVTCRFESYKTLEELRKELDGFLVARIKHSFLVDHFVTILQITDNHVIVADPLNGKHQYTIQKFEDIWRFCGLRILRK